MQKLNFDLGLKKYEIGGGVLRFNPMDPNVFARFVEAGERLCAVEKRLVDRAAEDTGENATGEAMLQLMADADREAKEILAWVFGAYNDFDAIFCGTNIMGVGNNGERILTNFIYAIQPVMETGAKECTKQQVNGAVAKAQLNRTQRRAAAKK